MKKQNAGGTNCYSCGSPVRIVAHEDGWAAQCSRCVNIEELLEQLIRKQLRAAQPNRLHLVHPSPGLPVKPIQHLLQ